jgi:hypothetical protein
LLDVSEPEFVEDATTELVGSHVRRGGGDGENGAGRRGEEESEILLTDDGREVRSQ